MSVRRAAVVASALLVACESAANLDIVYAGEAGAPDARVDPPADGGVSFEGCPCDESQGAGCCVPRSGTPYCTTDEALCAADRGLLLRCFRDDALSESACCWNAGGTRLAAGCDGGASACLRAEDCAPGQGCATTACGGIVVGTCGATRPPCP